jgi:hypothetical protein
MIDPKFMILVWGSYGLEVDKRGVAAGTVDAFFPDSMMALPSDPIISHHITSALKTCHKRKTQVLLYKSSRMWFYSSILRYWYCTGNLLYKYAVFQ